MTERPVGSRPNPWRRRIGWLGVILSIPFFVWLVVGLVPGIPSMTDLLSETGVRYPAAVAVFGLLLAFIGFYED